MAITKLATIRPARAHMRHLRADPYFLRPLVVKDFLTLQSAEGEKDDFWGRAGHAPSPGPGLGEARRESIFPHHGAKLPVDLFHM